MATWLKHLLILSILVFIGSWRAEAATVISCNFNVAIDVDDIEDYDCETGDSPSWSSNGSIRIDASEDYVATNTSSARYTTNLKAVGQAAYDVSADLKCGDGSDPLTRVVGGVATNSENLDEDAYHAGCLQDGSSTIDIELVEYASGTPSVLGTYDLNGAVGTFYNVLMELRTSSQKVYVDSTERITATDSTLTGQYTGIYFEEGSDSDSGLDDFLVETPAVGGANLSQVMVVFMNLLVKPAFADDVIEYYESDICEKSDLNIFKPNKRYPCVLGEDYTSASEKTVAIIRGDKYWVKAINPYSGMDQDLKRTRTEIPKSLRGRL